MTSPRPVRRWLLASGGLVIGAWLAWPSLLEVPEFSWVRAAHRTSESYLLDRRGAVLQQWRVDRGVRRLPWVPLADVSPALLETLVEVEDHRFWQHNGVDLISVTGALRDRLRGRPLRGASTLTMQLAGRLKAAPDDGPRRSWRRKVRQILFARAIARQWTREEVLEAYVNVMDWRGELSGIAAAAAGLYGKRPSELDRAEARGLVLSLRSPSAQPAALERRGCRRWPRDCAALAASLARWRIGAIEVPLEASLAPHLAARMLRTPGLRMQTTLDASVQREVLQVLQRQLAELGERHVRDGAAMVVDNASGDVLAYVGSAGPRSTAAQVDGVIARRQAGSTLKPFLYALAIEQRRLTAASLLDDSPLGVDTSAGLYVPQNYDRSFRGLVSLRTALASSLNVPAVRTLQMIGLPAFHARLQSLGYGPLDANPEYYGQSLSLGSLDVTLAEQAQAYVVLARGGTLVPLRIDPLQPDANPIRVVDPAAAFVISDILADRGARAPAFGFENPLATGGWSAVKTGTSRDMRDNWCIGYTPRYTVAVWVGNFEGDPMRDVSGVSGAAPAWSAIVSALDGHAEAPRPPPGVESLPIEFAARMEPARDEWFLRGTAQRRLEPASLASRARLVSPMSGVIVALDPDIPPARQLLVAAAHPQDSRLTLWLDGTRLGTAAEGRPFTPQPGRQRIELRDAGGAVVDRVEINVRGAASGVLR